MQPRRIRAAHPAVRDDIGTLVTRRPLPGAGLPLLDPFLFLNHHGPQTYPPGNAGLPFGPHPHRGFETVTFILAGELAHRDSGGHESVIGAGGVQWMTAGRGLVHAELSPASFKARGGPLEILQLWVNLPARLKFTVPAYTGLQADDIPVVQAPGARVRLVAGAFQDTPGAIEPLLDHTLALVEMDAGARLAWPVAPGRQVLLYAVRGTVAVEDGVLPEHHLADLDDTGDTVRLHAPRGAVLLFGHAAPLLETVVAHGPFVMNTRQEIVDAIADFHAGRLGGLS